VSAAAEADVRRDAIDATAALIMIGLTFSWGLNQVAVKVSTLGYDPIFLTTARSAIAAVFVYAWCRYRRIPLLRRDGTFLAGILVGALFGGEFALVYVGYDYTSAARGALMLNSMPFWVLIGGHFFLGERITPLKFTGLALAFIGVVLVFSDKLSLPGPGAIWGDVLCLIAGAFWAATIIIIKATPLATASAEKTLLYQLVVSTLVTLPLMAFSGPILREVSVLATASLNFQAIVIVAFTYMLFFWLMTRYPASGLSSFAFLTPAFGVLCAGMILGEPLSLRILLALVLIGAGLILVNRPVRKTNPG
jgi:drug/metabolite transporter (DMT)-like permease